MMKTPATKKPMTCLLLALCLGAAPTAWGQGQFIRPPTPEQEAALKQSMTLLYAAAADQRVGRFAQAEAEARQGMTVDPMGANDVVLALALESEGKIQEALQVYQSRLITQDQQGLHENGDHLLLPYAQLLLASGQWVQAVAAYNADLPFIGDAGYHTEVPVVHDGDVIRANSHFSPDVFEPNRLALMIHLTRAMEYDSGTDAAGAPQKKEAFAEYGKALQLAPDSDLANYYYGVGWNNLSPAERKQFGSFQQAKAALEKAVKLAKGPMKAKAQKALRVAMNTAAAAKPKTP